VSRVIRVELPAHLRTLARVEGEVRLQVEGAVTLRAVLNALEAKCPMLCGTIRDHVTKERRPFVRFFACEEDLSHDSPDNPLPEAVASAAEPLLIVGAIAGGRDQLSSGDGYRPLTGPNSLFSNPARTLSPPRPLRNSSNKDRRPVPYTQSCQGDRRLARFLPASKAGRLLRGVAP